ncbi:MAG: dihydrofolate reductase family protein [Chloroflexi bacterium]|nr:dihydrofolate reductase family protein [Chloroflexota bacterium]
MRKVCLGMNVSLDGYVAKPNGELDWVFRIMSPDMGEWVTNFLRGVDTILLGHTTYLQQAATWPRQTGEMATLLNSHAKIVFSTRLSTLEWNNSRLATADAAEEVAQLKEQSGKNIFVSGGATLAQSLACMGLIDEYNLVMHPIVLGSGKQLFRDLSQSLNLKLVSAKTFALGAIGLTYHLA